MNINQSLLEEIDTFATNPLKDESLTIKICIFIHMPMHILFATQMHGSRVSRRVVTVPVSVPFSVPVQNCRNFSVVRLQTVPIITI